MTTLVLFLMMAAQRPKTSTPDTLHPTPIEEAKQALETKDYSKAVTLLHEHLKEHATDFRAWFNLAYAYTLLGDRQQAEESYIKTLEIEPQLFQARLNLAILLMDQNRPRDALPHLAAATQANPKHARACLLYAQALYATGDHTAARREYENAVALDPASVPAHLALATLALENKDDAVAERQLLKVLELAPSADVHRRLGALYMEQKKLDAAIAEFEQAAKLDPADEDDWNLARAYASLHKPGQALPHLARLRQTQPKNFDVLLLAGQMLVLKRDFPAAQAALVEAVRLQPQIPDPYVDLANVMYLQERYQEALTVLDRMAKLSGAKQTPWSAFLRAITLDKLGAAEPALESYQRFLAISTGQYPDQEFQARQRIRALNLVLEKSGKRRRK